MSPGKCRAVSRPHPAQCREGLKDAYDLCGALGEAEPSLLGLPRHEPERPVPSPEGLVQGLQGRSEGRTRPGVTVPTEEETPP